MTVQDIIALVAMVVMLALIIKALVGVIQIKRMYEIILEVKSRDILDKAFEEMRETRRRLDEEIAPMTEETASRLDEALRDLQQYISKTE